jgi:hypothetical protein
MARVNSRLLRSTAAILATFGLGANCDPEGSRLPPARDIAGDWRGGMAYIEDVPRPACKFSGSLALTLETEGNHVEGLARYTAVAAEALIPEVDPVFCTATGSVDIAVTGTVSSSGVTFASLARDREWCAGTCAGASIGSFTSDLMRGVFASRGPDLTFRGCFQVTRTSLGGLPDCNPFRPGEPIMDGGPVSGVDAAGIDSATPRDAGADAGAPPACSEPRTECLHTTAARCGAGERCWLGGPEESGCCAAGECGGPAMTCSGDADCCAGLSCLTSGGYSECRATDVCSSTPGSRCESDVDCCPELFCSSPESVCVAHPS